MIILCYVIAIFSFGVAVGAAIMIVFGKPEDLLCHPSYNDYEEGEV